MSTTVNSQFDQGLNDVDWTKYPELMQKIVSVYMIQMSDTLNKLRSVIAYAQGLILVGQLKYGFNAAESVQISGATQAAIGGAQMIGGVYQVGAAFKTAAEMKGLTADFEKNCRILDSQLDSAKASIEPVPVLPVMNEIEEDGTVIQVQQLEDTPKSVSQERVDEDALRTQKKTLEHKYDSERNRIEHKNKTQFGIGQTLSGLGGLLHVVDGGVQGQRIIYDAANAVYEHNYQAQAATLNSVNETIREILGVNPYDVNVASTRA